MAKMSQKMMQTINTLKMLGMAWTRAFTTTLKCKVSVQLALKLLIRKGGLMLLD